MAASVLPHLDRPNVVGRLALQLHLVVIDPGAFLQHDLRDRVGEVALLRQRDKALQHRGLGMAPRDDQGPGMRHPFGGTGRRHEEQVNRVLEDGARRQDEECPVRHERHIEVRERTRRVDRHFGQMRLDHLSLGIKRLAETQQPNGRRHSSEVRELPHKAAVHKHQAGPVLVPEEVRSEGVETGHHLGRVEQPELAARNRLHVREVPILVLPRRESSAHKAIESGFAQRPEPGRGAPPVLREALECVAIGLECHAATSWTQS